MKIEKKRIISNVLSSDYALKLQIEELMYYGWEVKRFFCFLLWQFIYLERSL